MMTYCGSDLLLNISWFGSSRISVDSTLYPGWYDLIFKETWHFIPEPLLGYVRYVPTREYRRFRSFLDYIRNFAGGMVKESKVQGDGKDIMSVLLRANESTDLKNKMADNEVIDQISFVEPYSNNR